MWRAGRPGSTPAWQLSQSWNSNWSGSLGDSSRRRPGTGRVARGPRGAASGRSCRPALTVERGVGALTQRVDVRLAQRHSQERRAGIGGQQPQAHLALEVGARAVAAQADRALGVREHRRAWLAVPAVAGRAAAGDAAGIEVRVEAARPLRCARGGQRHAHEQDQRRGQRSSWHARQTSPTVGRTQKRGTRPGRGSGRRAGRGRWCTASSPGHRADEALVPDLVRRAQAHVAASVGSGGVALGQIDRDGVAAAEIGAEVALPPPLEALGAGHADGAGTATSPSATCRRGTRGKGARPRRAGGGLAAPLPLPRRARSSSRLGERVPRAPCSRWARAARCRTCRPWVSSVDLISPGPLAERLCSVADTPPCCAPRGAARRASRAAVSSGPSRAHPRRRTRLKTCTRW